MSAMVSSDSMAPLLRQGDRINIIETQPAKLQSGDLVVMHVNRELIVHRYWVSQHLGDKLYLITKGDRLAVFDPLMPAAYLVGRVVERTRNHRVISFTKTPGLQLNRVLSFLSHLEIKTIGPMIPSLTENGTSFGDPGMKSIRLERFERRTIRRFFYFAARALVLCLELSGKRIGTDQD